MFDYTCKTVFIGIDVHKKTYATTAICDGTIVKCASMEASPEVLLKYILKYFSNAKAIHTAYEAGFSGFVLHRFLINNGINNYVVNPASIEIAARERVKTDKRDSKKIAQQLSEGRLSGIHVPEIERQDFRVVTRLREWLVRDRRRKGAQLKMFLHQFGKIKADEKLSLCKKGFRYIQKMEFSSNQKLVVDSLINQWQFIDESIDNVEEKLKAQAIADDKLEKIYRSLPGVGPVIARVLANELGDMSQFSNQDRLFSFTGLTPREYSSGERKRLGHISKQGRSILRKLLVQAAWTAIEIDSDIQEFYNRVCRKGGKKRAIVAVARRMIGHARICIKEERMYRIKRISASTVT